MPRPPRPSASAPLAPAADARWTPGVYRVRVETTAEGGTPAVETRRLTVAR